MLRRETTNCIMKCIMNISTSLTKTYHPTTETNSSVTTHSAKTTTAMKLTLLCAFIWLIWLMWLMFGASNGEQSGNPSSTELSADKHITEHRVSWGYTSKVELRLVTWKWSTVTSQTQSEPHWSSCCSAWTKISLPLLFSIEARSLIRISPSVAVTLAIGSSVPLRYRKTIE